MTSDKSTKENSNTIDFSDELQAAYLDYSISVIVGRAIPDCRDGLKPVHRRILFAMYKMNNTHSQPHKKCAKIVGSVLGGYHPHGDGSVYSALVRLAQPFSVNHVLIDGQGNFGSIDDDPPAAQRYTEARLDKISQELLESLEKNAVDFVSNYDGTLNEPSVLPAKFPLILINGAEGIAVGMATSILPHNLREVIDASIALIKNESLTDKKFYSLIKGPDFPTGGILVDSHESIVEAMKNGKGSVSVCPQIKIEKNGDSGKKQIVVCNVVYQSIKSKQIEKISEIIRDKKIKDISELRDESDGSGVRIVFELRNSADVEEVSKFVIKHFSGSLSMNNLAIVKGAPKILSVRQMIEYWISFRRETVIRISKFDLKRNKERAHILEGLLKATKNIDAIIKIIRECKKEEGPKEELIAKFDFSDKQAQAILDMKLSKISKFEYDKVQKELDKTKEEMKMLVKIIDDKEERDSLIIGELQEISKKYGRARLTKLAYEEEI